MLSRSIISGYLDDHYLTLQARIMKDPVDSKWLIHYRPIAAVAKYSGSRLLKTGFTRDFFNCE